MGAYGGGGGADRRHLRWPGAAQSHRQAHDSGAGGIDARDRAWYAYLGGTDTGVVARDGTRFQVGGKVRVWWDTSLALPPLVLSG